MTEYPKALYMDGDAEKECRIVADVDEESLARDDGFQMIGEAADSGEATAPRRGRPRKSDV